MLRSTIAKGPLRRVGRSLPLGSLLVAGELALMVGRHAARLDASQRRRLLELLREAGGRPGSLTEAKRRELAGLVASLEPRLFLGSALRRLSPMPLPKRLLYGRRGSSARKAISRQR
jgi:hypothetical protein